MDRLIELDYAREDFEEIYFTKENSPFKQIFKKEYAHRWMIPFILFFSSVVYSIIKNEFSIFIILTGILFLPALVYLIIFFVRFWKWRTQIARYLDTLELNLPYKVRITNKALCLISKNREYIEDWDGLKKVNIFDNYILLSLYQEYIFPKKSMTNEDFSVFKEFVKEKMI